MMLQNLSVACSGAVLCGYVVIGLFFWRFWRRTGARLFVAFAVAFFVLALERTMMLSHAVEPIHEPLIYLTRLLAFLIIAWAIWDINRVRR